MLSSEIKSKALELGYTACGIIPAHAFYEESKKYWEERVETIPESKEKYERFRPDPPPQNAKSIIVCTRRYNNYKIPDGLDKYVPKLYLMSEIFLQPALRYPAKTEFENYLETIGINRIRFYLPDRWAAAKAGLGKFGRNNFIYDPEHGSYIWIEVWVVEQELEYDAMPDDIYLPHCDESCNKCIQACPTNALTNGFTMNINKCIEHITMLQDTMPDEDVMRQLGSWLCGCDVCQDVCPHNQDKFNATEEIPLLSQFQEYLKLENIVTMDELEDYTPPFVLGGRGGLWKWKCSALRAMINSGEDKYHALIKQCRNHEDARIREVAEWGCSIID